MARLRVNFDLAEDDHNELCKLAERKGQTLTATIREALKLEKWWLDTHDKGGVVLVDYNGNIQEIVRL